MAASEQRDAHLLNLPRSLIYVPLCLATIMMLVRHVDAWVNPDTVAQPAHEANIT